MVVISSSVFTNATHAADHAYGIKKYTRFQAHSLTLAAIVDDRVDNGTLQFMNVQLWGSWAGPMKKGTFLTCERQLWVRRSLHAPICVRTHKQLAHTQQVQDRVSNELHAGGDIRPEMCT